MACEAVVEILNDHLISFTKMISRSMLTNLKSLFDKIQIIASSNENWNLHNGKSLNFIIH